jgi:hypothetical protein
MNNSKTILALVFLIAGTLLTTTAVTTMVPVVYADDDHKDHDKDDHDKKHDGKDGDGNKNKADDDSAAAIADCDKNDVERAGFECVPIAANDIEADIGGDLVGLTGLGGSEQAAAQFAGADGEEEEEEEET